MLTCIIRESIGVFALYSLVHIILHNMNVRQERYDTLSYLYRRYIAQKVSQIERAPLLSREEGATLKVAQIWWN